MYGNIEREKNKAAQEELYNELAQLGADAEAFRRVEPTEEQLLTLVQGIKRLKTYLGLQSSSTQPTYNAFKKIKA
jgi:hypothetical protein